MPDESSDAVVSAEAYSVQCDSGYKDVRVGGQAGEDSSYKERWDYGWQNFFKQITCGWDLGSKRRESFFNNRGLSCCKKI